MKKYLLALWLIAFFACVSVFAGCAGSEQASPNAEFVVSNPTVAPTKATEPTEETTESTTEPTTELTDMPTAPSQEMRAVEHVGQVPEILAGVIENNAFYSCTAFDGRLLKVEESSRDAESRTVTYQVKMIDLYGTTVATYTCSTDTAYHVTALTATDDGGFLFVLGFADYAVSQSKWASDGGFASRVIKCDSSGNVQFETPFDGVEGSALKCCFEKDGRYYFFGTMETPETKKKGVYSRTDVSMTVLDQKGNVLKSGCIAGSDYDSLMDAELTADGFVLSISAQSDDGDFAGSNSGGYGVNWVFTVNDALEVIHKKIETDRVNKGSRIGEKDGVSVYRNAAFLDGFDGGTPTVFMDYGDFYLIVSYNITGVYEKTPLTSSRLWYYSEHVYSGYDHNGNLIFRTSVDTSPDYDAWLAAYYSD